MKILLVFFLGVIAILWYRDNQKRVNEAALADRLAEWQVEKDSAEFEIRQLTGAFLADRRLNDDALPERERQQAWADFKHFENQRTDAEDRLIYILSKKPNDLPLTEQERSALEKARRESVSGHRALAEMAITDAEYEADAARTATPTPYPRALPTPRRQLSTAETRAEILRKYGAK